ncbi:GH92 family glycosyl hydrolase [Flammeovirga kamogawensis]|uniref:GH92 family glycosyl hydrolase n=1 Tax=Flammeovirga kamogawensis TaxID=373891 RepID=A0ABX8H4W6_9BACT|nr:GH92 family glycosyl hydrolase [Flammeovirga kamogawensis]MBB6460445.1 putative alpha-1,2-mannosidase [Flammeovirga kamogawensis]QWG10250.1 GH92 family glycosyl hydrolase [Flammeovirga kamogawensis]TRX64699.1 glycoside hydrolase family 92 protein [Flammeovirga kamogawensis]
MKRNLLVLLLLGTFSCQKLTEEKKENTSNAMSYVDPFIGTGFHGHTFPGATTPNGMVQLSPDTRFEGWDACGGYYYEDSSIVGFSHTHLSGTGIGDMGDILMMPFTGTAKLSQGDPSDPDSGYRSRYSHEQESASPGYYNVKLEDYDIDVELTASPRVGFHQYTFPEADEAGVIIDLSPTIHMHRNPKHEIKVISDTEIAGMKYTKGWAKEHYIYFYAKFDKPFKSYILGNDKLVEGENYEGKNAKAVLNFSTKAGEKVKVKVGISNVDIAGAKNNLFSDIKDWDFYAQKEKAELMWSEKLALIDVEGKNEEQKEIFYTSMYHSFIAPMNYSDADHRYRTLDGKIKKDENYDSYTVFSLWDTYRAFHPLLTIVDPSQNEKYIQTLLRKYDEGGILPKWELAGNYTGTMTGYHAVPVMVDAYRKGNKNFDVDKAFKAMIETSTFSRDLDFVAHSASVKEKLMPNAKLYNDSLGYIPADLENESVTKALEYAYNDYCIALFAKELGKDKVYEEYLERSQRYKQYYDPETGFMRGKLSTGGWREPFNPRFSKHRKDDYTEGNAYQWSWYVPHDVEGLATLIGGKRLMEEKLDTLFMTSSKLEGNDVSNDISGMVGQYAHGNEPSHHIAYMYNYIGAEYKTQYMADYLLNNHYEATPAGIIGNEDCGQMSAWYILSSMGFYPMSPGVTTYTIGRPLFDQVKVNLENGKTFEIVAHNNSYKNKYIDKLVLDGVPLDKPFIDHKDIMAGKTLEFYMTDEPNKNAFKKQDINI